MAHAAVEPDSLGLPWDRRWMLVDPDGNFVTQRTLPALAKIRPIITPTELHVFGPEIELPLVVPLIASRNGRCPVRVWGDEIAAWDEGSEATAWFSHYAGRPLRLMRFPDDALRAVDPRYATRPSNTAFADGFPLLLATEESLWDLNRRLAQRGAQPVPMTRFRPNIVLAGADRPYAEDDWLVLRCGGQQLDLVKPCSRCVMITMDQQTGVIPELGEPLSTLSQYRRWEGKVAFAQNVVVHGSGPLIIDSPVTVHSEGLRNRWKI